MGQESLDSTILIPMIRDQIHFTISLHQYNILRYSFMDKLKEEASLSAGILSFHA